MKYFKPLLLIIIFLLPFSAFAIDIGFIVKEKFVYSGNDNNIEFYLNIVPRFSLLFGDTGMFFMSAEVNFYKEDPFSSPLYVEQKLLRTEMSFRTGQWGVRMGRIIYSDPLTYVVTGLFDGIHLNYDSNMGRAGVGFWFTEKEYAIAAVEWEHPSILDLFSIKTSAIGHLDRSEQQDKDYMQYLSFKIGIPVQSLYFEVGGATGSVLSSESYLMNQMLAGYLGVLWNLPTNFRSMLSLTGRYTGGELNDFIIPYNPISDITFGNIFKTELTAVSILTLDYTARISNPIGASLTASYFIKNDLVTPNIYPIYTEAKNRYLMGGELWTQFTWSPFSDMQFILGGGAFVPALGNVWPKEKALWRVELTANLSL